MTVPSWAPHRFVALVPLAFATAACSAGSNVATANDDTSFLSHIPGSRNGNGADAGSGAHAGGDAQSGTGGNTSQTVNGSSAPPSGADGAAERAIAEADILRVEGTRLYALSQYSGLSVVDVSDPTQLRLVGAHHAPARPFEMYVDGDRAYVMYNGWTSYHYDEDGYRYVTTSRVQALDISDPAAITLIGDEEIPGEISDSRKVGEVLYLVTHEDSYCWGCAATPNTRVTSFDVSDPSQFSIIDEHRFESQDNSWGRRSISVTSERIYVSGWSWVWDGQGGGLIDVVDISDPSGVLQPGAQIDIAGPIESRWQMDEYEGVLRVISQPGGWGTGAAPVVEIFQVDSSASFQKLASLDVVLPRPEELRSVRFDGERAYAITFERTDPLFTFDLSDPAAPQQLGELEIPGWVYHMEPRGDRIYALGFDDTVQGGALHVSLFDVSDMTSPVQLSRVNFGGDWGSFAEDQDRIHKAFAILPEVGLILVPFSGYSYNADECSYRGSFESGIQLVDMTEDSLALRGVAPQTGQARRALLVEGNLLGISDNAVQSFDISDRDDPAALGRLDLARNIQNIRVMGNTMLRFGTDWWTGETNLDFALLDRAHQAEPLGNLDLSQVEVEEDESCNGYSYWDNQVLVHGSYAYVPRRSFNWSYLAGGEYEYAERIVLYIVDISERTHPRVVGSFRVETKEPGEYFTRVVKTDNAILVGRSSGHYWSDPWTGERSEVRMSYDVIALDDPVAPRVASTVRLPRTMAAGGFGYGVTGCAIDVGWGWWGGYNYGYHGYGGEQAALVSGDLVVSQHEVPVLDGTGRVRYYLDRLDVSDPDSPVLLPSVNIPGGLVDFEGSTGRIVTIDYQLEERSTRSWEQCSDGISYLDWEQSLCRTYRRRLNTLLLDGDVARRVDTALLDRGSEWAGSIAATKSRLFHTSYDSVAHRTVIRSYVLTPTGGLSRAVDVLPEQLNTWGSLLARDNRAFLATTGAFTVVDTADPQAPRDATFPMGGYHCSSLEVTGDTAYCALGQYGVQAFPLE